MTAGSVVTAGASTTPSIAAVAAPGAMPGTLQRDAVAKALGVSHFELGRLLREKIAPLPVRFDSVIYWYTDEVEAARDKVSRTVARWRLRRRPTDEVRA